MTFFVLRNILEKKQLEEIEKLHDNFINKEDDFEQLVKDFVKTVKSNGTKERNYRVYSIVNSVNRIIYSYKEFKKSKNADFFKINEAGEFEEIKNDEDIKESSMVLVFLNNAKAFLDCAKGILSFDKLDGDLFRSIALLRNYCVHFYDTKMNNETFITDLIIERGMRDYSALSMVGTGEGNNFEISFSMPVLYFSMRDVFYKILNRVKNKVKN